MMAQVTSNHLSLQSLAEKNGEVMPCAGNLPLTLDDPNFVWLIESGSVNLFLVEIRQGIEQSLRQHIMHCGSGFLLPGVVADQNQDQEGTKFIVIAKGIAGTILRRIPVSCLDQVEPAELSAKIDAWVLSFSKILARFVTYLPRAAILTETSDEQILKAGTYSIKKGVTWITDIPEGSSLFMDVIDGAEPSIFVDLQTPIIPLTNTTWLTSLQEIHFRCHSTEELINRGLLSQALAGFHLLAFSLEHLNRKLALVDDANLERLRKTSRDTAERISRERLYNIYDLPVEKDFGVNGSALIEAMKIISQHEKIEFHFPNSTDPTKNRVTISSILDRSAIRSRVVRLKNEDQWWTTDGCALLAFRQSDNQPVVLIPRFFGRYWLVDPVGKTKTRMNAHQASLLQTEARMFYSPLPEHKLQTKDLARLALHHSSGNIIRLVLAGIPGGVLNIIPALALGFSVGIVFENGDENALLYVSLAVIAFGLIGSLLFILQKKSLTNIQDRAIARLEAAFWDRVMRLPSSTTNLKPSSEIAIAGTVFQQLRNGGQLQFIESLLSMVFMLPLIGFIFYLDFTLGLVTSIFCTISLLLSVLMGFMQIESNGRVIRATQKTSSKLFQIIKGIVKFRIEGAEGSAYAIWAEDYRDQKRAEVKLGSLERHSQALGVALPFLAGATLFATVAIANSSTTPIGDFLVVYLLFLTFLTVTIRFGESISFLASGVKAMKQLNPVLDAETEGSIGKEPVEHLNGEILFDRVSFRYDPEGPLILDDVTIHARPGEFIAIVGESGAGKSTLFKLALGIDQPTSGAVLYDGHDLRHLNLKQLRQKVGSVPQSIQLNTQDIWDNIAIKQEETTTKMVWESVRAAQIENEIKAMPMGLMTVVGSSDSVLSGGERQRITLARSLLGNPSILLLDEATNWLDNNNQAEVMQNLAIMDSTRIVIAHRLSTLEKADRIYVLKSGKIVQTGTFQELRDVEGVFKNLIDRQDT